LYCGYQLLRIGLAFQTYSPAKQTSPNQSSSCDIHTQLGWVWFQNLNSINVSISQDLRPGEYKTFDTSNAFREIPILKLLGWNLSIFQIRPWFWWSGSHRKIYCFWISENYLAPYPTPKTVDIMTIQGLFYF
jgi:hypothetical protein